MVNDTNRTKMLEFLKQCDVNYYRDGASILTEAEYDALSKFYKHDPLGYDDETEDYAHITPMRSIFSIYSMEEFLKSKLYKLNTPLIVTPKVDGIAINVIYKKGELSKILTRKNGERGVDITQNVLKTNDVPLSISGVDDDVEIRGELYLSREYFNTLPCIEKTNTRNKVAGMARKKNCPMTGCRVVFYDIGTHPDTFLTYVSIHEYLKKNNFKALPIFTIDRMIKHPTLSYLIDLFEDVQNEEILDCDIDGLVIRLNDLLLRKDLRDHKKYNKEALAYKLQDQLYATKVLDISERIGEKTGRITPVLMITPVTINGAIISQISMYNSTNLISSQVKIGDHILVRLKGKVFPEFVSIIPTNEK